MSTNGDDPFLPPPPTSAPIEESLGFGPPGSVPPPGSAQDVLPDGFGPPPPSRRGRKVAFASAGAAVAVVAVAGGSFYAYSMLSGGGAQPETVVPSTAIAYADVDLDPSAGQKIEAYRFLRKFPSTDRTSSEGDLVGQVVKTLVGDSSTVSYDRDIKPWVGKRAAIAAVPKAGDPTSVQALVVIQVTDEAKARTDLRRLLDQNPDSGFSSGALGTDSGSSSFACASISAAPGVDVQCPDPSSVPSTPKQGLVVRDGYALIGETQAATDAMSAAAQQADLASSATYQADMKRITAPGVASAWIDLDALNAAAGSATASGVGFLGVGTGTKPGRFVAGLRFDNGTLELAAHGFGGSAPSVVSHDPGGALLAKLPSDVSGAVAIGDLAPAIDNAWASVVKAGGPDVAQQVKKETGLTLPADLKTLLGTSLVATVGDFTADKPDIAVRVRTTEPDASKAVLDRILYYANSQADGFFTVPTIADARSADGIVYAATPQFAAAVAADGTLGQDPTFTAAVPDAATATVAAYVNVDRIVALIDDPSTTKDAAPLKSFGLTVRTQGTESDLVARLATH